LRAEGPHGQRLPKRILSLLLVPVAVGAGVWYLYAQGQGDAPQYRLERAERGPLVAAVSATGNLNAVTAVQVGTQVSGQITELHADFNSVVRRGQVIARIDPATFESKVRQARADVDSAKATVLNQEAQVERARADVENALSALAEGRAQTARAQLMVADTQRDLGRKRELFQRALIPKSDYDTAQAAYDAAVTQLDAAHAKEQSLAAAIGSGRAQLRVAEAMLQATRSQVEQKEAVLHQARLDLEHTTIRAPVDGVVVSRAVDVGQTVAASLAAPTLFTIARDLTKMQVEASVGEADIGRVRIDGPAKFTVDAFPGEAFKGRVMQVRKAAQIVQNVVTYIVIVAVDNPEGKLLPGMTANVKLIVAEKPNVLKVPNAALRFRPPGPKEGKPKSAQRADGPQSPESSREQLVRSLGLTAAQQAKLDPILNDSRRQLTALRVAGLADEERQAFTQGFGEATRARIRTILTSEQRARYDQLAADDGRSGVPGRVWALGPNGVLQPVALTLGLTDGSATEVRGGDLREGQEIVVGLAGGGKKKSDRAPGLGR
jgi:HlyD family secretion protein